VNIVMTGGSGFIGRRLASRLLQRPGVESILLFDVQRHRGEPLDDPRVTEREGDISDFRTVCDAIGPGTNGVFHLGAVVSAGAEADFDLGMRVNLDGTRNVLEACRKLPVPPRLVFGSSEAVYGGTYTSHVIDDDTPLYPQTSYGTQKACGELLVSDYSRKGFVDGRSLRFPTIIVRPEPNLAASTFTSTIVREPLLGRTTTCPVSGDSVMALMSVAKVIDCIEHAFDLDAAAFGTHRSLLLPAVSASVRDIIEAVRRAGGDKAAALIAMQPDPAIQRIVDTWPREIRAKKAEQLGFQADANIDAIVATFVAEIALVKR
jgi:nucleoside-diphosphate-sugar epimerase